LYKAVLFWFLLLISEPTANVPLTVSSNNESSFRDLSSVEGNERTQAIEAEVSNKPEIKGEKNAEPHSTPTENGSDHPVSPTEAKLEDNTNLTGQTSLEGKTPVANNTTMDNLTPEPMEIHNDTTEDLSPCDMDISSPD